VIVPDSLPSASRIALTLPVPVPVAVPSSMAMLPLATAVHVHVLPVITGIVTHRMFSSGVCRHVLTVPVTATAKNSVGDVAIVPHLPGTVTVMSVGSEPSLVSVTVCVTGSESSFSGKEAENETIPPPSICHRLRLYPHGIHGPAALTVLGESGLPYETRGCAVSGSSTVVGENVTPLHCGIGGPSETVTKSRRLKGYMKEILVRILEN